MTNHMIFVLHIVINHIGKVVKITCFYILIQGEYEFKVEKYNIFLTVYKLEDVDLENYVSEKDMQEIEEYLNPKYIEESDYDLPL